MRQEDFPPSPQKRQRVLALLRDHPGMTAQQLAEYGGRDVLWTLTSLKGRAEAWTDDGGRWYVAGHNYPSFRSS